MSATLRPVIQPPVLADAERVDLFYRALDACPDPILADNERLMTYLVSHGVLCIGLKIVLDAAIDEARAQRSPAHA